MHCNLLKKVIGNICGSVPYMTSFHKNLIKIDDVCLFPQSDSLFLNCGHVCCCQTCAEPLFKCPLCRADIISKVNMGQFQLPVA